jgi:glycosyltransferase involved in cell wall biosynthesis
MGEFIVEALKSVGNQTYANWEIIAVDDAGPEDGTHQAVADFKKKYPNNRIEYIKHKKNRGVSAARNTAMKLSKGEYLAFLDPDDCWGHDYLKEQLNNFISDPQVTASFTNAIFMDKYGQKQNRFLGPNEIELNNLCKSLYKRNFINPSAIVIKADAVIGAGCFDENPILQFVEDWDLWLRLCVKGYKFKFNNSALSYYRRHENAATHDAEKFVALKRALREKHLVHPDYRNFILAYLDEIEKEKNILSMKISRIKNHSVFSNLIKAWRHIFNRNFDILE